MNILFMMSGSIAAAKATGLISEWVKQGHEVRVACTPSVQHFVGRATLEGFSGYPVFDDTFAPGSVMDHISLAAWAEWVVVCPATANLLGKFAHGLADDAVTTLWQAAWSRKTVMVIVPAMNGHMWDYPATRENVEKLRSWGVHVLPTASGDLACGEQGEGRMLEVSEILERVDRLMRPPVTTRRILVTSGGTREPIDAVRFIGNFSTGKTARVLTDELAALGHAVTWLGAEDAQRPSRSVEQVTYVTFDDLQSRLVDVLAGNQFDLVVHAAAVSDFSVADIETMDHQPLPGRSGKIASSQGLLLRLEPNPKLLGQIRHWSSAGHTRVVGFKLTVDANVEEVQAAINEQLSRGGIDAVVHNDLSMIREGRHVFAIHQPGKKPRQFTDSTMLAHGLQDLMETNP